jgi:hypothetical protein
MSAPISSRPARWQGSDEAIRAVQVAFDVEATVLETVRRTAFESNISASDQIRRILGLYTPHRPKRPRLTVTLTPGDYEALGKRYGLDVEARLDIKERVTQELIDFTQQTLEGSKK